MKKIKLNGKYAFGKEAIVDDLDFEKLNTVSWRIEKRGRELYYAVNSKGIRMHSFLMNTPKGMHTDHMNGDGLDNQRENLRNCTASENIINSKIRIDNTSGYKGVCWVKNRNKWRAYLKSNKKTLHLGMFLSKEEAARAYDNKVKSLFGNFGRLNFV